VGKTLSKYQAWLRKQYPRQDTRTRAVRTDFWLVGYFDCDGLTKNTPVP
jgi:hypothetical protein